MWLVVTQVAHSPQAVWLRPVEQGSTQLPLEHTSLVWHCESLEQPASHVLSMQTVPSPHWLLLLQMRLQAPSLQTSLWRQSASALEHFREQRPLRQTPPAPQAASPEQVLDSGPQPWSGSPTSGGGQEQSAVWSRVRHSALAPQ